MGDDRFGRLLDRTEAVYVLLRVLSDELRDVLEVVAGDEVLEARWARVFGDVSSAEWSVRRALRSGSVL